MIDWSDEELRAIDKADDLKIAPFHEDRITIGTPTWIWEVVVDGGLFVRAYNGKASRWYQSAIKQLSGKIIAAGKTEHVVFETIHDPILLDKVDNAYHAKYGASPYVSSMVSSRAKAATIKIHKA